jgi:hypothetical protein
MIGVGNLAVLAQAPASSHIGELIPIGYVATIVGSVWYLSGRLQRIDERLRHMSDRVDRVESMLDDPLCKREK